MFSYRLAGAIVVILLIVSSRDAGESLKGGRVANKAGPQHN